MLRKIISISILSLLSLNVSAKELSRAHPVSGYGFVYHVIDGDTFIVNVEDDAVYKKLKSLTKGKNKKYLQDKFKGFRIRLANTNTAESKHQDESRNTAEGIQASYYTKRLIEKKRVYFNCWGYGKYNRTICSVSLNGQDVGINLIENGYSDYVTYWGEHPYLHEEYEKARN